MNCFSTLSSSAFQCSSTKACTGPVIKRKICASIFHTLNHVGSCQKIINNQMANRRSCKVYSSHQVIEGGIDGSGLRIAIVVALFNEIVTMKLLDGAVATLRKYGVSEQNIEVCYVPGSFELAVTSQALAEAGNGQAFDAVIAIGTVIRGSTTHYDVVVNGTASGVQSAQLKTGKPIICTLLTCEDLDQALARAGGHVGNKGSEGALAAIEMANLFKNIKKIQ